MKTDKYNTKGNSERIKELHMKKRFFSSKKEVFRIFHVPYH